MINKVSGLLGLSSKGGKVISGSDVVLEGLSKGIIELVLIAEDASEKTIKNFKFYCNKYNTDVVVFGTIIENSKAIGKNNRAIIGIKDKNLADAIKKVIHGGEINGKN